MLNIFFNLNEDGGSIKSAGYIIIFAVIALICIAVSCIHPTESKHKFSTKQLVFCAICIALAYVTSRLKIYDAPMGGSVTLFSMFFITLIGYFYGPYIGIVSAIAYGLIQLVTDPYIVYPLQIIVDYPLAFGALGISGFFRKQKYGLMKGYIAGIIGRFIFATLSGIIFFAEYAYDGWNVVVYSVCYNGIYIGIEGVITIALLCIPAVKNGLMEVSNIVQDN